MLSVPFLLKITVIQLRRDNDLINIATDQTGSVSAGEEKQIKGRCRERETRVDKEHKRGKGDKRNKNTYFKLEREELEKNSCFSTCK